MISTILMNLLIVIKNLRPLVVLVLFRLKLKLCFSIVGWNILVFSTSNIYFPISLRELIVLIFIMNVPKHLWEKLRNSGV